MMKRVEGKTAVVTGGSFGIGRATALTLAEEGTRVTVTDIQDAEGKNVADEIKERGGTADDQKR
ncbi:MAG TPA: SDR family NAD(P)-dependent oxidoreductase, partial [Tichowtungia sp.]|nr:SDR family NAD(P)-dependent oxidoreductase [Tichowtungia sp.]